MARQLRRAPILLGLADPVSKKAPHPFDHLDAATRNCLATLQQLSPASTFLTTRTRKSSE